MVAPIKVAVVNVNAHWMPGISWRLPKIAAACKRSNVDLIMAQELMKYDYAEEFSRLMGWGGKRIADDDNPKRGDSCVLHGGFAPVATGLIWNPKKIEPVRAGSIVTYRDWPRNKWATWADLNVHGKRGRFAVTHTEFEPKGPNNIPKYDKIRFEQVDGLHGQLQKPGRTLIVAGDMNHDRDDKPDAIGNAWEIHGMREFDVHSTGRLNGDRTLTKTTWTKGGRIIRGAATPDVRLTWQNTIRMFNWTDHNMLVQEITIPV